jgi:hypothetical protein
MLGGTALPARAAFTLFDNFDSYNTGSLNGQGGWVTSPTVGAVTNVIDAGGGDKEVTVHSNSIPNYKPLGALSIPNASTAATVYFNFKMAAATTGNNFNFVITDVTPTDTAGTSEVQFNYDATQAPVGGSTTFRVRNAGAFPYTTTGGTVATRLIPVANAQYNAWFVINNSADTYQLYMQSDADPNLATPTLITGITTDATTGAVTSSTSTFGFRNGTAANDLITANFGNGATAALGAANAVNFDDIFVDLAASNTTNPVVPEPASLALIGLGGIRLLVRRRRA